MGEKAEPPPTKIHGTKGRSKRTKGRNLVERLICKKKQCWHLPSTLKYHLPITLKRELRPVKVNQKISNCFRTVIGAEIYAQIEGFISTAEKTNVISFPNYAIPLKDIILLPDKNQVNNYMKKTIFPGEELYELIWCTPINKITKT